MPKGHWIAHVDVQDPEAYKGYLAAIAAPFARYGARFLVRAGRQEAVEGPARGRTVGIEFPTIEIARACYACSEYQARMAIRPAHSGGEVLIAEGCEP